jgi:ribosomal protein S18 acetylase RimI-like enzyme
MNIRFSKPQDIKQVVSLANRYASFDSAVTEADFQCTSSFPKGLIVADDDGLILGFVFGYIREIPDEVLTKWNASKAAQIELLVVDPSYRGQGIGRTLLDKLLEAFKEEVVDLVLLHCPAESKEARHLYERVGFQVRAYAMEKRL